MQIESKHLKIKPEAAWPVVLKQAQAIAKDAWMGDSNQLRNLAGGQFDDSGSARQFRSANDGTNLFALPMQNPEQATRAVQFAKHEQSAWGATPIAVRKAKVASAVNEMKVHAETLALLLAWEIGKPMHLARADVNRCLTGVEWYIDNLDTMLGNRRPVGLVSNIASWNYPMSVLMHSLLVEMLAGNSVIAKTPTDGGAACVTTASAIARRHGLPISVVSGSGGELADALVRGPDVDCVAFVGGRTIGRDIVGSLSGSTRRFMLEMEGLNAWGIWNYSDWPALIAQLKKGFEYGKQRCTAYPRLVVERRLLPKLLSRYLPMLAELKFGHPLAVADGEDYAALDFGPLINRAKVTELTHLLASATANGGVALYEGTLESGRFLDGQDTSAYLPPHALFGLTRGTRLYHAEPFGPIDSIVVVDTEEELASEMNVSNGALCASIATDDPTLAAHVASEVRAFKIGVNKTRSRGDRDEPFGGVGSSWKGAFVGGKYLVEAVTAGAEGERLYGNFAEYTLLPSER
jgi:acyl-CoA reductase-like NAD-dependent aldehyde dehydrogenase